MPSPYVNDAEGWELDWDAAGMTVRLDSETIPVSWSGRELDDVIGWLTQCRQERDGTSLTSLRRLGEVAPTPPEQ